MGWIREFFTNSPDLSISVESDAVIGLTSGTNGIKHGIVLIAGTGSIALGLKPNSVPIRVGGWG